MPFIIKDISLLNTSTIYTSVQPNPVLVKRKEQLHTLFQLKHAHFTHSKNAFKPGTPTSIPPGPSQSSDCDSLPLTFSTWPVPAMVMPTYNSWQSSRGQ